MTESATERRPLSSAARTLLESRRTAASASGAQSAIPQRTDRSVAPISMLQERFWVLDQLEPGWVVANRPLAFALDGPIDIPALEWALGEIVRRHEALRTAIAPGDGGTPVQRVVPFEASTLPIVELDSVDSADGDVAARTAELLREEARRPFDLAAGRLLRAQLIRTAAERHILTLTSHHIAADGWSDAVLLGELGTLYAARLRGEPSPLPPLPLQYGDFATWQRESAGSAEAHADRAYWHQRLDGVATPGELPADAPRTSALSFPGARISTFLPNTLLEPLTALGRSESASLPMVFLAAFAVLLARLSGDDDVVIGMQVAGRSRSSLQELIGLFTNAIPMRVGAGGDLSFRALLRSVRADSLQAYDHQSLPVEAMVSNAGRAGRYAALARALLNVRLTPPARLELPGIAVEQLETTTAAVVTDVHLDIAPVPSGMRCTLEYNAALFSERRARRMLGHFETLLGAIVASPDATVAMLPLLTDAERTHILRDFNATAAPLPYEQCLHELVEQQVQRSPDRVAAIDAMERVTYAELDRRANVLAATLRRSGVGPRAMVCICMERSVDMMVALLAILKAGAAYVPLDPALPPERLALITSDVAPPLIVTDLASAGRAPRTAPHLVITRETWSQADTPPEDAIGSSAPSAQPSDPTYVLYTSGSTGLPKGVLNSHRGICNRLLWTQSVFRLTADDCLIQKTPISFDVSVWEIFWGLITGARVVLPAAGRHIDHEYLADLIREHGVTIIHFVPSMLQRFLEAVPPSRCPSLQRVLCSGEALPPQLVRRFFERYPEVELHNLYGPTEAAVDVSHFPCARDGSDTVPIGRPISNMQMYVLDARREPVPIGVTGEIWLGGVGIANGYLNRPELTAERFVPDPFRGEGLLYRTGDLGRYDDSGTIEFLGRTDHQVKIQGVRVELGEIEAVLARHADVHECVVTAYGSDGVDRRFVAYVVGARADAPPDVATLRQHMRASLPEILVPAVFMFLHRIPLNANGKVDRRALPEPDSTSTSAQRPAYIAPWTATESIIAATWAEVLDLEQVGRDDDFFALGGDSLGAVRAAVALGSKLGMEIPVRALFEAPTLRAFAAVVSRRGTAEQVVLIQPGRDGVAPLFILHGDFNGGGTYCRQLATCVGPETPVYSVYPHEPGAIDTIEAMAADLRPAIRAAARGAPYRLVGHCNGGVVAFELARQLTASGETVELLCVVDAGAPHRVIRAALGVIQIASRFGSDPGTTRRGLSRRARSHLVRLGAFLPHPTDGPAPVGALVRAAAAIARSASGGVTRRTRRRITRLVSGGSTNGRAQDQSAPSTAPVNSVLESRYEWYVGVMQSYVPRPLRGRLTLVIPTGRGKRPLEDSTLNWGPMASSVDVHVVRGDHLSIVGEHVAALGEILRAALEGHRTSAP